jgi:hypothetical protein
MDEERIVQSAWTHLLYFAYVAWIYHVGPTCRICTKKTFFDYQNIILCHLGGPHDTLASVWPTCQLGIIFFGKTQNDVKMRFKPMTPWPLEAFTTRLLLQLCCCASYYFFVLCSGVLILSSQHSGHTHLFGPVNMAVKFKLRFKFKFKFKLMFKFAFKFLWIYSKFCPNLNSSSILNSIFFEFNSNSNPSWGPLFCPIGFIPNIAQIQTQIQA